MRVALSDLGGVAMGKISQNRYAEQKLLQSIVRVGETHKVLVDWMEEGTRRWKRRGNRIGVSARIGNKSWALLRIGDKAWALLSLLREVGRFGHNDTHTHTHTHTHAHTHTYSWR
jgi:hypothetical protein